MNSDILISAANWLYLNSPAGCAREGDSAMLVCGDGELADALFDLMFTTAFQPGVRIELVRVTSSAEDARYAFFSRNVEQLEYFESRPGDENGSPRPIAIRFLDEGSDWRSRRYAWAVLPEGVQAECGERRALCLEGIPILHPAGETWSRADEALVPVLGIARRVHTAYTLGRDDRYREEDVDRKLYGSASPGEECGYALRSSLRLAVGIPWKLSIAEAHDAWTLLRRLGEKKRVLDGHTVRDYLVWQEHRSWQAFMMLDSWRMPTPEEMADYMFRGGNDHCDRGRRLHPCLCDLAQDDWFSGKRTLEGTVPSEWSRLYSDALGEFTLMDQMSLRIHHRCKEIVLQEQYRADMQRAFDALEGALITSHPPRIDIHFDNLRAVERLFARLLNNELNSYHPYEQACKRFFGALEAEEPAGFDSIRAAFGAVTDLARVAVERNQYRDYRRIDADIIDWLPWIIADTQIDTLWKLHAEGKAFTNLMSAMILRPKKLVLVCRDRAVGARVLETYGEILSRHGLGDVSVSAVRVSELEDGRLPVEQERPGRYAVDVSEAPDDLEYSVDVPPGTKVVYLSKGRLRDRIGAPPCAAYCPLQIRLTIDEVLRIQGKTVLSMEEDNLRLGMEEDYLALWRRSIELKAGGSWRKTIQWLNEAEKSACLLIYRDKGRASRAERFRLGPDGYDRLIRNGGMRALYDLQRLGAISNLLFNPGRQEVSLTMYPREANREMDYSDSLETLRRIICEPNAQSRFVVDVGYVARNAAIEVFDLNAPIPLEVPNRSVREALDVLFKAGLLVRREGADAFTYKSPAIRDALKKEGFALEAYVYYTLFLSGRFDDVRCNVRLMTKADEYQTLETELDILVAKNGRIGIISCKDTPDVIKRDASGAVVKNHVAELAQQAKMYGVRGTPVLICAHHNMGGDRPGYLPALPDEVVEQCELRGVELIGYDALDPREDRVDASRRKLIEAVARVVG